MKYTNNFFTVLFISFLGFGSLAVASEVSPGHLVTTNPEIAKASVQSYNEGHYRYLQNGQMIEAYDVDLDQPSCVLESGHMLFHPENRYQILSTRSLDVDGESGEIELTLETLSDDPEAYFEIYCFQSTPGATLETARAGLKGIFGIEPASVNR